MKDLKISSLNGERGSIIKDIFSIAVIVSALGYFVDIYDLILFSIVRIQSLKALGISGQELMDVGVFLLDIQMAGMLLGGILWGIFGDKKGRVKILFGSIFLYSIANIANGFVETTHSYAICRFIAGIGLAGELGAGVTLVVENLPQRSRGYGTMLVATVGVAGAVLANYIAKHFDWRTAYFIGGGLGLLLLIMRVSVYESGMYKELEQTNVSRGNFFMLFNNRQRFFKYINSILIGLPIWFCVGVLITFSPEFAKTLNVAGPINAGEAVMFCYIGLIFGDFLSGFLSQYFKSRKKIVLSFQFLTLASIIIYLTLLRGANQSIFYLVCGLIGFGIGYWAVFITVAAEQFGTNIRATVTSTVPNFIRGTVIPITLLFHFLKNNFGILNAGKIVGILCVLIAVYALYHLEETYHKDLNYIEEG